MFLGELKLDTSSGRSDHNTWRLPIIVQLSVGKVNISRPAGTSHNDLLHISSITVVAVRINEFIKIKNTNVVAASHLCKQT